MKQKIRAALTLAVTALILLSLFAPLLKQKMRVILGGNTHF
jgi:hypothetical protein